MEQHFGDASLWMLIWAHHLKDHWTTSLYHRGVHDCLISHSFSVLSAGYHKLWWRGLDSNQRRRAPTDLQSAPFSHSGTPPTGAHAVRLWPSRLTCQRSALAAG